MTVTVSRYSRPQPFSEDSSAPRRQLDGGGPPAANGRGGGQTHPQQRGCPRRPCGCAVLVVARPDGVCPEQRPAALERSGVVAVVDTASRQARASVAAVQQAVSTHPVSGVRDPAVQSSGVRSPGVVVQRVRRSAVCCPPVRCPAVCCPAVRSPAVGCLPPSVRTRPSPPTQAVAMGSGRGGRATVTTGPVAAPVAAGPSTARATVAEARTRATLPTSRWSGEVGGGPGPPGWVRAGAAARAPGRPGRPGRRGERPSRAAARWAHVQAAARGGGTGRVAGVLGWCATTVGGRRRA
jgi:hypothetical protein